MIKNVALKVFLQNTIFSLLSCINRKKSHNHNKIMLYSNMGFRDNIKALYDFLIENGYNNYYEIICSTNDIKKNSSKIPNVKNVSNLMGIFHFFSAGFVYYCFGKIPILPSKDQKVVQMWHGSPYKSPDKGMISGHSWEKHYYTNVFSASKHFVDFWSYAFSMPKESIIICGHPRCDVLFKDVQKYDFGTYDKIILWAPTFRKSSVMGYNDTNDYSGVVPVILPDEYPLIDKKLGELKIKLVVKLHPLQSIDLYNTLELQNFILLTHDEFCHRKMNLYMLMKQCDALITDYSSIFYDFLLLDRPIAFTEDDLESYSNSRGFAVNDPNKYKPGVRIKETKDLIKFLIDVKQGIDEYKGWRHEILDLSNDYRNGGFSKRALECVGIEI